MQFLSDGESAALNSFANFAPGMVWACDLPWDTPFQAEHEQCDFSQVYGPQDIEADLYIEPKILKWGAWLSRRHGLVWEHLVAAGYEHIRPRPVRVALALRFMRLADSVPWRGGFPRPRGYYGLALPRGEAVLANEHRLCWVVLGEPTPRGTFAFVFDSLQLGKDGQPHPRGLFRLSNWSADLLWSALRQRETR